MGIRVLMMSHHSESEEFDRYEFSQLSRPLELFAKWRSVGCRELFGGFFRAPDELVNAFLDGSIP